MGRMSISADKTTGLSGHNQLTVCFNDTAETVLIDIDITACK